MTTYPSPDAALISAFRKPYFPAVRAWLATGATSPETRTRLFDETLTSYESEARGSECGLYAERIRVLLANGDRPSHDNWSGPAAWLLAELDGARVS